MFKIRVYLTVLYRLSPKILALEAVYVVFSWLLHKYWIILQRFSFSDVLFVTGALAATMGSIGMLRNPYDEALSPWGVWASPIQPTEREKQTQIVDELIQQKSFGLRILAVGVITILLSIVLTYI